MGVNCTSSTLLGGVASHTDIYIILPVLYMLQCLAGIRVNTAQYAKYFSVYCLNIISIIAFSEKKNTFSLIFPKILIDLSFCIILH